VEQIDYKKLSEKLPQEAVERTKGADTGKGYDTTGYRYQYIANRLNEVLGVEHWIAVPKILKDDIFTTAKGVQWSEVGMEITIAIGEWENGVFITGAEKTCYGGHQSKIWGDAAKGAFTNALKKTAGLFGVGKEAYEVTIDDDSTPVAEGEIADRQPAKKIGANIQEKFGATEVKEEPLAKLRMRLTKVAAMKGKEINWTDVNKMNVIETAKSINEMMSLPDKE
jgi:hypothetical protein